MGGPTAVEESSTGEDLVGDPPAREGGSTEGGLVGDPPAREGASTEGGLVGDPPARDEGSTEGGLVGDPPALDEGSTEGDREEGPPVLAGGLTNTGSRDRRAGAQTAVRQVRVDGRRARRLAVHERGALVREAGRRPKAADCPAAPIEGGGGQGGMAGAAAWPAAGGGGERAMGRGHRDRHSDRTGGGSSGGVARTVGEEVGAGGGAPVGGAVVARPRTGAGRRGWRGRGGQATVAEPLCTAPSRVPGALSTRHASGWGGREG